MPAYGEGWTGDPVLDGYLWSLGAPLNGELILVEAEDRPVPLVVEVMDRAVEHGVPVWRIAGKPRGSYLLVESRRTVRAFLEAIGWSEPPDRRYSFVEIAVKENGRPPPDGAPAAFFSAFFAGRIERRASDEVRVAWPAPEETIAAYLDEAGIAYEVPAPGEYRFPDPSQLPGRGRYERHRRDTVDPSVFEVLELWPPLREQEAGRYGAERVRKRLDEAG